MEQVARELRLTKQTIGKWRTRFLRKRLDGLLDEPRPGAPRRITDGDVDRVMRLTLETAPRDASHWRTRAMPDEDLHTLSRDPLFIEKVQDIVGLYLNPPDKALVLCVHEKAQIQAPPSSSARADLRDAALWIRICRWVSTRSVVSDRVGLRARMSE